MFYVFSIDNRGNVFYLGSNEKSRCTLSPEAAKARRASFRSREAANLACDFLNVLFSYGETRHHVTTE